MKNQHQTCTVRILNNIYFYIQFLNTIWASKLNCSAVQHENNKSYFTAHDQVCLFFFWEDEDIHRTKFDFDIKFENGGKVS